MINKVNFFENTFYTTLEMLKSGIKKSDLLTYLANQGEIGIGNNVVVSILILDQEGKLRNGASPKLPADYLRAIDGLQPHPTLGTCASAAATGEIVITTDFTADNKWAELKHLPLALGFVGAWSMPIKNKEGKVLGTFGTYHREKKEPSKEEIKGVEFLAKAASIVISSAG